jgi:putative RNA 2'-phosphotransferase
LSKRHKIQLDKFAGFLAYVLGRRPDEFGLVPDKEGYVSTKRLLQAIKEEPGWGHVGEGLLREVLLSENRHLFESDEKKIRALERHFYLDLENQALPPKSILFSPIRRRAHFHALDKGLRPKPNGELHILTDNQEMAHRIGRRFDPSPILLEIHAPISKQNEFSLYSFGKLFLTPDIPRTAIVGPPLAKEALKERESDVGKAGKALKQSLKSDFEAGTFVLDGNRDPDRSRNPKKGQKRRSWKEAARKTRRNK